jgi:Protein of unknown function (DUF3293)
MNDDPGFANYPDTVLEFADTRARIDLRRPIDDPARRIFADAGLTGSFAVITACNPRGRKLDDAANSSRASALLDAIHRLGLASVNVDGLSPDASHREQGVGVDAHLDVAAGIARAFQQTAFFWYDGSIMWIVMADSPDERIRLPLERPAM